MEEVALYMTRAERMILEREARVNKMSISSYVWLLIRGGMPHELAIELDQAKIKGE